MTDNFNFVSFIYLFVIFWGGYSAAEEQKIEKKNYLRKLVSGFLIMEEMIQVTLIQFTPSEQLTCNLLWTVDQMISRNVTSGNAPHNLVGILGHS